jgi:hypothetical protein
MTDGIDEKLIHDQVINEAALLFGVIDKGGKADKTPLVRRVQY